MARLFIFNCSNDMALASGAAEYMPPKSVARMEEMYSGLPLFVADEGDVALAPGELAIRDGFRQLCGRLPEPITEVCPWGWSKPMRNRLLRFGVPESMLPDVPTLDILRGLSSREFGAKYAEEFYARPTLADIRHALVSNRMRYVSSADELSLPDGTYIAKSPWSSSGRGNKVFVYGKEVTLTGFPRLIDRFYDKVLDFAMEFRVSATGTRYLGLSVFKADREGRYEFNYVGSQTALTEKIRQAMSTTRQATDHILSLITATHVSLIDNIVAGSYHGPLGIDMMVVNDAGTMRIHPIVELNFRMNMGILALKAYQKYADRYPTISLRSMADVVQA